MVIGVIKEYIYTGGNKKETNTPGAPRIKRRKRRTRTPTPPVKKINSFEERIQKNLEKRENHKKLVNKTVARLKSRGEKRKRLINVPIEINKRKKTLNWDEVTQQRFNAIMGSMPPPLFLTGKNKAVHFRNFARKGYVCSYDSNKKGCSEMECKYCKRAYDHVNFDDSLKKLYETKKKWENYVNEHGLINKKRNSISKNIQEKENKLYIKFLLKRKQLYDALPCYWNDCYRKYGKFFKSQNKANSITKGVVYFPPGTEPKPFIGKPVHVSPKIGPGVNNASPLTDSGLPYEAVLQIKVAEGKRLTEQEQKNWNMMTGAYENGMKKMPAALKKEARIQKMRENERIKETKKTEEVMKKHKKMVVKRNKKLKERVEKLNKKNAQKDAKEVWNKQMKNRQNIERARLQYKKLENKRTRKSFKNRVRNKAIQTFRKLRKKKNNRNGEKVKKQRAHIFEI